MTYRYYVGRKAMFDSDFKQGAWLPPAAGAQSTFPPSGAEAGVVSTAPSSAALTPSPFHEGNSRWCFLLGTRPLSPSPLCPFLGEGPTHVCPTCGPCSVLPCGLCGSWRHSTWGLGSSWLGSSLGGRALVLVSASAPVAGAAGQCHIRAALHETT